MYFVWICWCQILVVTMCQNRQAPSNLPAVLEKVVKPYQWGTHLLVMEAPPALCPGDNPWKTYEKPEGFAWLISEMVIKHGKKSIPPCISVYICIYIIFSGFSHCIIFAMNDSPFWGIPQYTHTHFFDKSMCPCVYTRDYIYIYIYIHIYMHNWLQLHIQPCCKVCLPRPDSVAANSAHIKAVQRRGGTYWRASLHLHRQIELSDCKWYNQTESPNHGLESGAWIITTCSAPQCPMYSFVKVDGSESWVEPSMSKKMGDRWLNSL